MLQVSRVIKHPATSLLMFQVTSFLTPWLIVVWLSFQSDLTNLANFSLLLAILAPLTLFFTAPSRNFMLSNHEHNPEGDAFIRLLLLVVGLMIALGIGLLTELLLFSVAVYLYKSTEFLFDFSIVKGIKTEDTRYLWSVLRSKTLVIVAGMLLIYFIQDIKLLLFVLAIGFTYLGLSANKIKKVKADKVYSVLVSVLPLSITSVVFSIYFNIPRYVLGGAEQVQQLSIYTVTSFIWVALLVLANAVCQSKLYVWTKMYQSKRIKPLFKSVAKTFILLVVISLVAQVFHFPSVFDFFWLLHNNLHQNESIYVGLSHLQVSLVLGPVLFSAANFLLMIVNKYSVLLILSLLNALVTAGVCAYVYEASDPNSLIWVMAFSGVAHCVACSVIFVKQVTEQK